LRIIAATNRNLEDGVRGGEFREDLYYRLRVLPVNLPSVRERAGDIPLLVKHYIDQFNREFRREVRGVSPDAMKLLESHAWPGNVRELRNAVERAMLLTEETVLSAPDFQVLLPATPVTDRFQLPAEGLDFEQLERDLVVQALERAGGNQTRAAALLGMNRDQIRYRVEKFGLAKLKNGRSR
jgi:DNA-binding NtrC family response regulator